MSSLLLQHAERRWQTFVLVPLNVVFVAGIAVSAWNGRWLLAGGFVFLVLYIGTVGARLTVHRGKGFEELSQGITPELPEILKSETDLAIGESRILVETMVRTLYAVILAAIVLCFAIGMRWYWSLLVAILVWFIGQPVGALGVALVSRNR
jgi:hypothetical protein